MTKDKSIFIRNIYYMLTYAFQNLKSDVYEDVAKEDFENILNMFSSLLAKGIGMLIKRGLYKEYVNRTESLSVVHGKIELNGTIQNRLNNRNQISCNFDELSEDNLLNQILKSTVLLLLRSNEVSAEYKSVLKKEMLFFSNVSTLELSTIHWNQIKFHRNSIAYKLPVGVCQLIVEGMLNTTEQGTYKLMSFIDEQRMSRLYEKFILEYYAKHHPELHPNSAQIPWALEEGYGAMLPIMHSDIHLQKKNTVLIIDAKYYTRSTQEHFNKHTYHSANMYQIFTYVKNEEYKFKEKECSVSGILLYAKTDEQVQPDETFKLHGNQFSVKTLDLNVPFYEIASQLEQIIANNFNIN